MKRHILSQIKEDKQVAVSHSFLPPRHPSSLSLSFLLNFNWEASKWAAQWLRGSSNKPGASALQASEDSPGPLLSGADQLKNLANSQLPHGPIWNKLKGPPHYIYLYYNWLFWQFYSRRFKPTTLWRESFSFSCGQPVKPVAFTLIQWFHQQHLNIFIWCRAVPVLFRICPWNVLFLENCDYWWL